MRVTFARNNSPFLCGAKATGSLQVYPYSWFEKEPSLTADPFTEVSVNPESLLEIELLSWTRISCLLNIAELKLY